MDRRQLLLTALTASVGLCAPLQAAMASEKKSEAGNASFVALSPATGVIPRRDGRRSTLTVEIGIDVPDRELRERAVLSRPRLTAAHNEVVRTAARSLLPGRVPDIEALGRSLQTATDAVLGRPGATLLLGSVIVL